MIIQIKVDQFGELGWDGDRLCSLAEYEKALSTAQKINPKYPRDLFLPLDYGERVKIQEGVFVVQSGLTLEKLNDIS